MRHVFFSRPGYSSSDREIVDCTAAASLDHLDIERFYNSPTVCQPVGWSRWTLDKQFSERRLSGQSPSRQIGAAVWAAAPFRCPNPAGSRRIRAYPPATLDANVPTNTGDQYISTRVPRPLIRKRSQVRILDRPSSGFRKNSKIGSHPALGILDLQSC